MPFAGFDGVEWWSVQLSAILHEIPMDRLTLLLVVQPLIGGM